MPQLFLIRVPSLLCCTNLRRKNYVKRENYIIRIYHIANFGLFDLLSICISIEFVRYDEENLKMEQKTNNFSILFESITYIIQIKEYS